MSLGKGRDGQIPSTIKGQGETNMKKGKNKGGLNKLTKIKHKREKKRWDSPRKNQEKDWDCGHRQWDVSEEPHGKQTGKNSS